MNNNNQTKSLIFLHGLGADGDNFRPIEFELSLTNFRFVFPDAPIRSVSINFGMPMRAWYNIYAIDPNAKEDENGIQESTRLITTLIEEENARGVKSENIFLGGFSQGGAMALYAGLRYPEKLGGIIALSTYLPLAKKLDAERSSKNQATPIFMTHGTFDDIIPLQFAEYSRNYLQSLDYKIDFHTYDMGHFTIPKEIADLRKWLQDV